MGLSQNREVLSRCLEVLSRHLRARTRGRPQAAAAASSCHRKFIVEAAVTGE